jgi:hypothetical protein
MLAYEIKNHFGEGVRQRRTPSPKWFLFEYSQSIGKHEVYSIKTLN